MAIRPYVLIKGRENCLQFAKITIIFIAEHLQCDATDDHKITTVYMPDNVPANQIKAVKNKFYLLINQHFTPLVLKTYHGIF